MDTDGNIRGLILPRVAALFSASPEAGSLWGWVSLFVIFVIVGGFFGGSESGFSAMNKIRVKAMADDGDRRAVRAMYVANRFDSALTTMLIGGNIAHIASAAIATVIATRRFGDSETVTVLCTVITTLIVFLFSEMIPKSFANDRSETMALASAGTVIFFMRVFYPLTWFFSLISNGFSRLGEKLFRAEEEPSITEDELYDIIDTIEEEGVVDEEQGDLLKSALDFSETRARDVMTMRADIVAVEVGESNEQILEAVKKTTHSRLPVYEGDLDHVVGTLLIRNFIREYRRNPDVEIRTLLIPPFSVNPDARIDDLLSEMRQYRFYLAVVSDMNDGHTLGIITIEDFLEELVGEIWDEDDVVDSRFVKLGGDRFRVDPGMTLGELSRRIGIMSPEPRASGRPLISILPARLGRVPREEDTVTVGKLEITVESMEENRVTSLLVHLLSPETTPEEPSNALPSAVPDAASSAGN